MNDNKVNENKINDNKIVRKNKITLHYNVNLNVLSCNNILLIEDTVSKNMDFYNYVNANTFPIIYNKNSSKTDLLKILNKFTNINRIGFIFDDSDIGNKKFLDNSNFFIENDLFNSDVDLFSENMQFIINCIGKYNIKNIDYLVCNSLLNDKWKNFYTILNKKTGIIIGASNNKTGNIIFGADWIMESIMEDVKFIYWNEQINNYNESLETSIITVDTHLNNACLNDSSLYTWPITIQGTNSNPITITLDDNIVLSGNDKYFIFANYSNNIYFNGNNKTITISNATTYCGLIIYILMNKNAKITNLQLIVSNECILVDYRGWLVGYVVCYPDNGVAEDVIINNCSVIGGNLTGYGCGGIIGSGLWASTTCSVTNCYFTGNSYGWNCGGIIGLGAFKCVVSNSYYTTGIAWSGYWGGIYASWAGNCIAINCYSDANNINAGAIYGAWNYNSTAVNCYSLTKYGSPVFFLFSNNSIALNCYAIATLNTDNGYYGFNAGTIFGQQPTNCSATNCYSIGPIFDDAGGGIFSRNASNCSANYCYSTGVISNDTNGIFGTTLDITNRMTNCYVANGNFNIQTANTILANSDFIVFNNELILKKNNYSIPISYGIFQPDIEIETPVIVYNFNKISLNNYNIEYYKSTLLPSMSINYQLRDSLNKILGTCAQTQIIYLYLNCGLSNMVINSNNNMYICTYDNGSIYKINSNKNISIIISGLDTIESISIDSNDNIYFTNTNYNDINKIYKIIPGTNEIIEYYSFNNITTPCKITGLTFNNNILFTTLYSEQLHIYYIYKFDIDNVPSIYYQSNISLNIKSIKFDSKSNLYISSWNYGLYKLDIELNFNLVYSNTFCTSICIDKYDNVYICNYSGNIIMYRPSGFTTKVCDNINTPFGIYLNNNKLFISSLESNNITIITNLFNFNYSNVNLINYNNTTNFNILDSTNNNIIALFETILQNNKISVYRNSSIYVFIFK